MRLTTQLNTPPSTAVGPRIVVVGTTCSGKTTLARQLAALFSIPHIELDALMWQPGWQKMPSPEFLERVRVATDAPAWVVDGNYSETRPLTWARAITLVWLDYPLPIIYWQLARRTLRRIFTRELLWGSNRETLRGAFFDKDSLFLYAYPSQQRQRQSYPRALREEYTHLQVIHLRSPAETRQWLKNLSNPNPQERFDEQRIL